MVMASVIGYQSHIHGYNALSINSVTPYPSLDHHHETL